MRFSKSNILCVIFVFFTNIIFAQDKINSGNHSNVKYSWDNKVDKRDTIKSHIDSIIDTSLFIPNFYSDSNKVIDTDTITISVLLPFYLEENRILQKELNNRNFNSKQLYKKSGLAISFLQGILLALDSLNESGINININVFDTRNKEEVVKELIVEKDLQSSQIIFGPLYPDLFKIIKNFYRNDTNKILINPLSSKLNFLSSNNVYFLKPIENFSYIDQCLDNRRIVLVSFENNVNKNIRKIKGKFLRDSIEYNEHVFSSLKSINKKSCSKFINGGTILINQNEDPSFVNRFLSYCGSIDEDVRVIGDSKWKYFKHLNTETLMKLDVHIPVYNYFDRYSSKNKRLLHAFETKFYHQMDDYSLLSFRSILHFCSDKRQFSFIKFSKNGGYINSDVRMCVYKDYNLSPIE